MIEEISYGGWGRNLRIRGATTELVLTLGIGPRVIRYALLDGKNVFFEHADQMGGSGEDEWMIRGGHRFWTAMEDDHSYDLDNHPVDWKKIGESAVDLIQNPSKAFGFQKTLRVELLDNEVVRVTHILSNVGKSRLDLTPWALSVMAAGGFALIPQPRLDLHPSEFSRERKVRKEDFWANREIVLWPFTNLTDGRYSFGESFLRVTQDAAKPATKIGLKLPTGWVAYQNGESVFAKYFTCDPMLPYPDRGSNFELFTNPGILELESLAPALPLEPGAAREHVEHWTLKRSTADLRDEKAASEFFAGLPGVG